MAPPAAVLPITDPLLLWRDEFPILADTTYMISHSLGAMPRRTADALADSPTPGPLAASAPGKKAGGRCPSPSATSSAPSSAPAQGRSRHAPERLHLPVHRHLLLRLDRPAQQARHRRPQLPFERLHLPRPRAAGRAHRLRPFARRHDPPARTHPRRHRRTTQLVSVSHVAFRSSYLQDLAAITARAHEVGALLIADLYQSAGTVPLDVRALNVDFATGGSVKWLLGGPGAGYLYVRRRPLTAAPTRRHWLGRARAPLRVRQRPHRLRAGHPTASSTARPTSRTVLRALRLRDRQRDRRPRHPREIRCARPNASSH